jgi:hypothetical protein
MQQPRRQLPEWANLFLSVRKIAIKNRNVGAFRRE